MKFLRMVAAGGLLMSATVVSAQQDKGAQASTGKLKSRADSVAYAFGSSIARDLKRAGLEEINASVLAQAVTDVFGGNDSAFEEERERELIMSTISEAREKMDARLKDKADAFMAENRTKQGIMTTASGLQYEVVRDGDGDKPQSTDTVTVHYKGQLSDGTVFDSSYDRGEPATFPLDRVIEGWIEGLQLMPEGAHYRFYIPYQLGYGERGAGQDIPPYSPLVFDVELLAVKKGGTVPAITDTAEEAK